MKDIRQTSQYGNYLKSEGWIVERINKIYYFVKRLSFFGAVIKIQRSNTIIAKDIEKIAHKYRAFQIIAEPNLWGKENFIIGSLTKSGFKLSKSPYLPTKTIHINLTENLKLPKETRRSIKIGEKNSTIKNYSTSNEIKLWQKAWKKTVKFTRYVPSYQSLLNIKKSFPQNDSLFLASHNKSGNIIGGALFTKPRETKILYYWYAFTNKEGRTSLSQYALLYYAILWAKDNGCKILDLEGIYDSRFPNRDWLGFTHFKRSFGGREVSYPGSFTKFRLPI